MEAAPSSWKTISIPAGRAREFELHRPCVGLATRQTLALGLDAVYDGVADELDGDRAHRTQEVARTISRPADLEADLLAVLARNPLSECLEAACHILNRVAA
jgi:hypothetical protein